MGAITKLDPSFVQDTISSYEKPFRVLSSDIESIQNCGFGCDLAFQTVHYTTELSNLKRRKE